MSILLSRNGLVDLLSLWILLCSMLSPGCDVMPCATGLSRIDFMACLVTIEEPGLCPSLQVVFVFFHLFVATSVMGIVPFQVLWVRHGQVLVKVGVQMFPISANFPSPRRSSLMSLHAIISSTLILHCQDRVLKGNQEVCMITCHLYILATQ